MSQYPSHTKRLHLYRIPSIAPQFYCNGQPAVVILLYTHSTTLHLRLHPPEPASGRRRAITGHLPTQGCTTSPNKKRSHLTDTHVPVPRSRLHFPPGGSTERRGPTARYLHILQSSKLGEPLQLRSLLPDRQPLVRTCSNTKPRQTVRPSKQTIDPHARSDQE